MASVDPMTAVRQYINDFNKGDSEAMSASFAAWAWAKGTRA